MVSIPWGGWLQWKWQDHVELALVEVEVGVELSAEMECCLETYQILEGLYLMQLLEH